MALVAILAIGTVFSTGKSVRSTFTGVASTVGTHVANAGDGVGLEEPVASEPQDDPMVLVYTSTAASLFSQFTQIPPHVADWNVGNVTMMREMFSYVPAEGFPDLTGWRPSRALQVIGMFEYSGFNQNIDAWNLRSAVQINNIATAPRAAICGAGTWPTSPKHPASSS